MGEDKMIVKLANGQVEVKARRRLKEPGAFEAFVEEIQNTLMELQESHSNPMVSDLDISQNPVNAEQFEMLFNALSVAGVKVQRYRLFGCPALNDEAIRHLSDHFSQFLDSTTSPTELHLSDCAITTDGFLQLMSAIEEKELYPTTITHGKSLPLYLRLENNYIDEATIQEKVDAGIIRAYRKSPGTRQDVHDKDVKINLVVMKEGSYQQKKGDPPAPEDAPPPKTVHDGGYGKGSGKGKDSWREASRPASRPAWSSSGGWSSSGNSWGRSSAVQALPARGPWSRPAASTPSRPFYGGGGEKGGSRPVRVGSGPAGRSGSNPWQQQQQQPWSRGTAADRSRTPAGGRGNTVGAKGATRPPIKKDAGLPHPWEEQFSAHQLVVVAMVLAADVRLWEVVGGGDKGGVLVRRGRDMSAPKEEARLATGALVKELELTDNRLHYSLLEGKGPVCGWVSIEISNKALLVQSSKQGPSAEPNPTASDDRSVSVRVLPAASKAEDNRWTLEEVLSASDGAEVTAPKAKEAMVPRHPVMTRAVGADMSYDSRRDLVATFGYPGSFDERPPFARFDIRDQTCLRVGGFKHGQAVRNADGHEFVALGVKCVDGVPRLFFQPMAIGRAGAGAFPNVSAKGLRAMFSPIAGGNSQVRLREASVADFDLVEDSDEEVVSLCRQCRLPLGSFVYQAKEGEGERHAECMAHFMLRQMQEEEDSRLKDQQAWKAKARKEHHIGWSADSVPENPELMRRLGYHRSPQHLCCLVFDDRDDDETTVHVSETTEPAGSVNLEYLSIALRCRLQEGIEPAFSLDPTSTSNDPGQTLQQKRFEPEWLAGTSVGEVLFQSDYLLKELSMGEHDQPVVGMRSCFDFSEEEGHSSEWRAREWYVVKHAGVRLSEDNVLVPHVEMAIEAREQFNGVAGIEDSTITRPSHPLVKYAEAFTQNFELIAERRSAVYHLRELAKACILAKFLVEGNVSLKDTWFHLAANPKPVYSLVLPQLWTDRCHSQVSVSLETQEGQVGVGSKRHSVYGGVEFGLDRFSISRPSLASGAMLARGASAQMSRVLGVTSVRALGPPVPGQPLRAGIEAQAHLQGVDLSLAKFDLSAPDRLDPTGGGIEGTWGRHSSQPAVGGAFWPHLAAGPSSPFSEEDSRLLRAVFNPHLSDRRADGRKFVPPDTSSLHVQRLRALVETEADVRRRRKEHFCSQDFVPGDAGPLFPSSWTSSLELTRGRVLQRVTEGAPLLPERYTPLTGTLPAAAQQYNSTIPIFDKPTEDGTRFRIYRCAGLEIRTTQEHEVAETVGAAFWVGGRQAHTGDQQNLPVQVDEKVAKVSEYVELAASSAQPLARNFYVVVETEKANLIVTEMLENGRILFEANPQSLRERNTRARMVRAADCTGSGVLVQDVQACRAKAPEGASRASLTDRKHFAQAAFAYAIGKPDGIESGFSTRTTRSWSELEESLGLGKTGTSKQAVGAATGKNRKGTAFGGVLNL